MLRRNVPVEELAESYTVSEDGLLYEFHLVPDARFHNSRPIRADDFKARGGGRLPFFYRGWSGEYPDLRCGTHGASGDDLSEFLEVEYARLRTDGS